MTNTNDSGWMDILPLSIRNERYVRIFGGLFLEQVSTYRMEEEMPTIKEKCRLTLKRDHWVRNGIKYWSLYQIYMHYCKEDPTEYEFANAVFNDWSYWQALCERDFFAPHIAEWRDELKEFWKMKAVKAMKEQVEEGTAPFSTLKYLADNGFIDKDKGRPSNKKIKQEAEKLAKSKDELKEDWERLGLSRDGEKTYVN